MGMTLPLLPRTLPKRTATNRVALPCRPTVISSARRLLAPIPLVGRNQAPGAEPGNRAAPLGPDRAGGSSHQDYLAEQALRDPLLFQLNRLSAQQVLQSYRADLLAEVRSLDHFAQSGDGLIFQFH